MEISYPPHPTNTCDPKNGNWFERLLRHEDFMKMAVEANLDYEYGIGFYPDNESTSKGQIKKIINLFMHYLPVIISKKLAPFVTIKFTK